MSKSKLTGGAAVAVVALLAVVAFVPKGDTRPAPVANVPAVAAKPIDAAEPAPVVTALPVSRPVEQADASIDKPYDVYLRVHPTLMAVAGPKVLRLPDGHNAVMGVAHAALTDGSPADVAKAEAACLAGAREAVQRAGGVQVVQGIKVRGTLCGQLESAGEGTVADALGLPPEKVAAMAQAMGVVGRWRSPDGATFFLAVGGVFDAAGAPVPATP